MPTKFIDRQYHKVRKERMLFPQVHPPPPPTPSCIF